MWPFRKQASVPEPISRDGMTATYDSALKGWVVPRDGFNFHSSGLPFNELVFDWSKEAALTIRGLDEQIQSRVAECLKSWPCNQEAAHIDCIDLDDYQDRKTMNLSLIGDETWGDFNVDIIIKNGKIIDSYGGD